MLDGKAPGHDLKSEEFGEHFVNFQGARTRYFDAYFQRTADAGARQVVILAAGLDSRAYRLPWPDGTTVFELDRPPVLDFKREVLSRHGATPRAVRREIAVDLREDWPQALQENGFDPAKPSAWIAEGLLIYLPAAAQEQLFTGIDNLACPGSHAAVEDGSPLPRRNSPQKWKKNGPSSRPVTRIRFSSWSTTSSAHRPPSGSGHMAGLPSVLRWSSTFVRSTGRCRNRGPRPGRCLCATLW
ncbi:hypothetical protein NIIDMKKI_70490 [Mycobacterium kansasii]|uniref:S-adenosyl-L-methionine-dependent methyltransferase n=1 Tax=Mycobacterium kansasii TaxID=1768 RepID=A0A7G1IQ05_MYCKA|nr:hypothetical protein NIIDMKKI_70490 [Mycobacterium kansasii]